MVPSDGGESAGPLAVGALGGGITSGADAPVS